MQHQGAVINMKDIFLLETIPSITGKSGRKMKLSSLRPGDVIGLEDFRYTVMINSVKLQRLVLRDRVSQRSFPYGYFSADYLFVRHQQKRAWVALLPKWLRRHVSPYKL